MEVILFEVPGQPQGKGRHRTGRTPDGRPVMYTPKKTKTYEKLIAISFMQRYPGFNPVEGPVQVDIVALFTIPKSRSKKDKEAMRRNEIFPTDKPDEDNIRKAINDALNGLAFSEDAHVVYAHTSKHYSDRPLVCVRILWGEYVDWYIPSWVGVCERGL